MNTTSCFALLFTTIMSCGIGCAPNEEDAADAKQPIPASDEDRTIATDLYDMDRLPALFPVAIMTPVLNVDPFHRRSTILAEFIIENNNAIAHQLETLVMDFGNLCPMLETVSLADDRGVMSDGACYRHVEFTIDEVIPAFGRKRLTIWATTNLGFESALTAIRMQKTEHQPGIRPLILKLSESMIRFDELTSGPPIIVRGVMNADEQECHISETDMGGRQELSLQFEPTETRELRLASNSIIEVPLIITSRGLDEARFTRIVHIAPEGSDVRITSGTLITKRENRTVSAIDVSPEGLFFAITSDILASDTRYALLLSAPESRGYVRFVITEEQLMLDPYLHATGCYPSLSDTFVVVPPDEWEASR